MSTLMKLKRLIAKLLTLAFLIPQVACANDLQSFPLEKEWDIRPENSRIALDMEVTKHMFYRIDVDFRTPLVDVNELKKFTGDSTFQIFTKDAVPLPVKIQTVEEERRANELVQKGVYEIKPVHLGIVMPVHVKIEKLNDGKSIDILLDETINTDREDRGWDRAITTIALKPGKYHIELEKFKVVTLTASARSVLYIAPIPGVTALKDNE